MSMPSDPRPPIGLAKPPRPILRVIQGGKSSTARAGARVLAVASGKGGVGKTSLTLNLGLALAALDRRVLLVDGDLALGKLDLFLGQEPVVNLGHEMDKVPLDAEVGQPEPEPFPAPVKRPPNRRHTAPGPQARQVVHDT